MSVHATLLSGPHLGNFVLILYPRNAMSGLLNYRKLRQDFSSALLKEGRSLYDARAVCSVQIVEITDRTIRLKCEVWGNYNNR
ncbi:hypothetical protein, partial [Candidatus Similichlamydia laticola]|uniref:hypothetical protein n=1 Tax=Candidatus Similichlamydia laticola TaxID=2170265 RepID=UPI001C6A798D